MGREEGIPDCLLPFWVYTVPPEWNHQRLRWSGRCGSGCFYHPVREAPSASVPAEHAFLLGHKFAEQCIAKPSSCLAQHCSFHLFALPGKSPGRIVITEQFDFVQWAHGS